MIFQADPLVYARGIALSIIATLMFNWGPIWQKIGLGQMDAITAGNFWTSIKRMFTNKKWLLGFAVGTGGGVFYFVALEIAGVTVVQPILNFGYIMLAIYARRLLGETLDRRSKVAIGLLIAMPAVVAFGDVTAAQPLTEFSMLFIFSMVIVVIIIASLVIAQKVKIMWAIAAGGTYGLNNLFLQWFTLEFFAVAEVTGNVFAGFNAAILPFFIMITATIIANFGISQIGL